MKNVLTLFFFIITNFSLAQTNTFFVKPNQTDINYTALQDSHLLVRNTTTNLNKLFLFIGGSGSQTKSYHGISNFVGSLGYDVINLAYPNSVPAAILANSTDSLAFDKYRQEICYGTPESEAVTVDSFNSIYTRTVKLLNYLHSTYPNQNWNQYLRNPSTLDWSKIMVAGHSQGSGHACYFGKFNLVNRVLMFSGPNDFSNHFANSAKWLRRPGLTELDRHFSYLSRLDEIVAIEKQLSVLTGLNLFPTYDTVHVDNIDPPYGDSHCLLTSQPPLLAVLYHNSTVRSGSLNEKVWTYMLSSHIVSTVEISDKTNTIHTYPNPTNAIVNITTKAPFNRNTFNLINQNGQTLKSGKISSPNSISIDLSEFPDGLYFIEVDQQFIKIIKQ